jgi:hypothetical protein
MGGAVCALQCPQRRGPPLLMGAARTDRDTPRQDPCMNLIITETKTPSY